MKPWQPRAEVVRIVDGDTFHGIISPGWGVKLHPRDGDDPGMGTVRVLFPDGTPYDAPERGTELGKRAKAYIMNACPIGAKLPIVSFALDDFGRTLAAVTLPTGEDWATTLTGWGYVK